jgi:hypothetical protein
VPAFDHDKHTSGSVRANVIPDDGVGRGQVVARQKESLCRQNREEKDGEKKAISESIAFSSDTLKWLHVFSLPPLRPLGHIELNRLALLKASETTRLNGREVHKNIFAILTADKAVAFGVIEPLYCSLFCHIDTCVPSD